jgi:hypothetical protein
MGCNARKKTKSMNLTPKTIEWYSAYVLKIPVTKKQGKLLGDVLPFVDIM